MCFYIPAIVIRISICFPAIPAGEQPTTSRNLKKHTSPTMKRKKNPWKNIGGSGMRMHKFNKIKDDQARKLVRRSVSLMTVNQTTRKFAQNKKDAKRCVNHNKNQNSPKGYKIRKIFSRKRKDLLSKDTLEEGEIRSEDETIVQIIKRNKSVTDDDDDDDDCILIEPTVDEVVINDEPDDDEVSSTSIMSTSYQSLINSFNQRITSTPCNKITNHTVNLQLESPSYAAVLRDPLVGSDASEQPPLFFVDVAGCPNSTTINSTDNFSDYTKLTTISDKLRTRRRSVRLKEMPSKEIIDLDDVNFSNDETLKSIKKNKLKRKSCDLDDSVIFISETNKNDFIPLTDESNIPKTKIPKIQDKLCTPPQRVRLNDLHTKSETKQLTAYNENAYNPSAGQMLTSGKRMVIIDGSNVAFKHSLDKNFSVKGLRIAIYYFEKMGHEVKAVIPQFRMNKNKSSDYEGLEKLHKDGKIVQTPCKNLPGFTSTSYDDRFILQLAYELDAVIVSNDNYRDLLHENPAFKKIIENRVIGYTWCNDIFIIPKDPYGKWGPSLHTILNR